MVLRVVDPAGIERMKTKQQWFTFSGFSHGLQLTRRGHPRFDGSAAQRCLKQDIDNGEDKGLKPKAFWHTRREYEDFPLKVFRNHLSHERRRRCEKSYWLNRNKTTTNG
jgi:hypothetical protein